MASDYEIRDGRLFGQPAKRIDVRCAHGGSTFFLLLGDEADSNAAAVDLLSAFHGIKRSCQCASPSSDADHRWQAVGAKTQAARTSFANAPS